MYDATGNKLQKIITENANGSSPAKTTTTTYMHGAVYEEVQGANPLEPNGGLQFIATAEGRVRIRAVPTVTALYDYMLKDHLGNVRTVLTDELKKDPYRAGFETNFQNMESQLFNNYINIVAKPTCFEDAPSSCCVYGEEEETPTPVLVNEKIQLVGAAKIDNPQVVGAGKVLKVMAGDHVDANVYAWFKRTITNANDPTNLPPLHDVLLNLFSNGIGALGNANHNGGNLGLGSPMSNAISSSISNFIGAQPNYEEQKAYLNWILLDEEQLKTISSGYQSFFAEVQNDPSCEHAGFNILQANDGNGIDITRNGYLYIFVSNTSTDYPVYFDDLHITHTRSPLLEETAYYPFGLSMNGISSKAANTLQNNKKYNGYELDADLDLNLYETFYRLHDPQIGRFWQIDPKPQEYEGLYNSMGNNPIFFSDKLGDTYRVVGAPEDVKAYIGLLSKVTGNTYDVDKSGNLIRTNKKLNTKTTDKISGTLSKNIEDAIKSKETVTFNVVNNDQKDGETFVDKYITGEVDLKDLTTISDKSSALLAGVLGHFLAESMEKPDISQRTPDNFFDPHKAGLKSEGQIVTEMLGIPNQSRIQGGGIPDIETNKTETIYDYGKAKFKITTGVLVEYKNSPIFGKIPVRWSSDNIIQNIEKIE